MIPADGTAGVTVGADNPEGCDVDNPEGCDVGALVGDTDKDGAGEG